MARTVPKGTRRYADAALARGPPEPVERATWGDSQQRRNVPAEVPSTETAGVLNHPYNPFGTGHLEHPRGALSLAVDSRVLDPKVCAVTPPRGHYLYNPDLLRDDEVNAIFAVRLAEFQTLAEHLFVWLNRGADSASRFFSLPYERVFEVGSRVEI